jgi:hypothetical protein
VNHTDLRALVARVDDQIRALSSSQGQPELGRAWDALVQHLALGPAPETRECPACRKTIMRAATLCGHCWTKLSSGASHA